MPSLPSTVFWNTRLHNVKSYAIRHLNFYRIHVLFFTFTPLIFSGLVFAANGEYPMDYIDCLFNSVSAMTVCGLATVDLSSLTGTQQALLFIQMSMGSPVIVSLVIVYIRRNSFARKFQHIVEAELARRAEQRLHTAIDVKIEPWWRRVWKLFRLPWRNRLTSLSDVAAQESGNGKLRGRYQLRPEMIRRVEAAPKLVDPSGWISEGVSEPMRRQSTVHPGSEKPEDGEGESSSAANTDSTEVEHKHGSSRTPEQEMSERHPAEVSPRSPASTAISAAPILRTQTFGGAQPRGTPLNRTQTVEFAATPPPLATERRISPIPQAPDEEDIAYDPPHGRRSMSRPTMSRRTMSRQTMSRPTSMRPPGAMRSTSVPRTGTIMTGASQPPFSGPRRNVHKGFGGFPMPLELLSRLFERVFPQLKRKLTRTMTIPRTRTIVSEHGAVAPGAQPVPYITFEAIVGRNSVFEELTREQLEELGGVEYRALTALLWIVSAYHFGLQLIAFVVIAPYMSINRWHHDFIPPALYRVVPSTWFSAFQVVSSYTNTGMSLVDQSMVPFQQAYPMIVFMIFLILAGNTAFPVLLRFEIWIFSKFVPKRSRLHETLHFLLDHPRRCFVYLFPSHQTWFLLTIVLGLTFTDWFFFLVLDIDNPAISIIPVGVRVIIGLLQATAVRSAGFATVSLASLAPAVKVLYVLMMYISVYPIAMSVRSTNVYEEKSLGVFRDEDDLVSERAFDPNGSRAAVWGRYLAMHARKQLSFDMWWLGLALFLVCIIEKDGIEDPQNFGWLTAFTILFELVSAYGTVGLSLGVPFANYSLSGALRPLSKLIICVVMLRGRHRGLPNAIDRAVMLPFEFQEGVREELEQEHDDLEDSSGRSSTTDAASSEQSAHELGSDNVRSPLPYGVKETSPSRGRGTAPKRVALDRDEVLSVEHRVDHVVDEQLRVHGLLP